MGALPKTALHRRILVMPPVPPVRCLSKTEYAGGQEAPRGDQALIVQQFLSGLFSNSDNAGSQTSSWSSMLHSNPGDYAWGQGGLDVVITQLLGQSENTGPPPAGKEMISSLPIVSISSEQAACRLECPVCREEYSEGESVRQLPCLHYFHSNCIVPWLQLHDTCPVCRKSLDGEDRGFQPQTGPPGAIPSPMNVEERSTSETL
ncbi:E3 ubiquitin-protein ligase RNF115 [Sinocyclocheilus grahami]|uniref:E3 ubiquitin-protein ligase RNF115 n=1 Tax=Sinocyclocheilus grahami TaxID=75366 RepID=UPI0007AC9AF4|nr:PREDICTED: E3 ubiquitin-protein ligase RNF115-like [Sinocyclocheilus grahami]